MCSTILRRTAPVFGLVLLLALWGCPHYVGVEWVTDYSAVGKPNVNNRDDCAIGFYDVIRAHPDWKARFNNGNADAWEEHFKRVSAGGTDDDWIDNVQFAYFAGHGAGAGTYDTGVGRGGGFTFGTFLHDDWFISAIPANREPRWGDKSLNFIVLDVCSALALKSDGDGVEYTLCERWANNDLMRGLHYIMGFRTVAHDSGTRGRIFAQAMTGAYDGVNHSVRDSWIIATNNTEGGSIQGAYLRAGSSGADTFYDHLHGCGTVSPDPNYASQCYYYCSWPCW